MSNVARVILGILAVAGAAGILNFLYDHNCTGYQVMAIPSPTKAFLATIQNNTCTPSHDPQTVVELTGAPGVTTWAFAAPSPTQDASSHSAQIMLTWLGNAELQIAYPRGTDVQSRVENVGNVKVVYKELAVQP